MGTSLVVSTVVDSYDITLVVLQLEERLPRRFLLIYIVRSASTCKHCLKWAAPRLGALIECGCSWTLVEMTPRPRATVSGIARIGVFAGPAPSRSTVHHRGLHMFMFGLVNIFTL
jgi:hypothetical protein